LRKRLGRSYDLMVIALAMAWLVQAQHQDCARPWEGTALTVSALIPFVSRTIGAYVHIPLTPLAVTALLAVVVARIRRSSSPPAFPFPSTPFQCTQANAVAHRGMIPAANGYGRRS
jgi:hypothetical protein